MHVSVSNTSYSGPVLKQVLDVTNADYNEVFCFNADGKRWEL